MHAPTRTAPVAAASPGAERARTVTTGASAVAAPAEVVYEVECSLDPAIVADFDAWLPGHVEMVLASPGFLGAELLRPLEPSPDGRIRRINRYRVRDRAALDHYLEQLAPALRQDGANRFGDRATYTRRVLASTAAHLPAGAAERCANCEARLSGPYCAECGQHAHESARALGTLFHDAWHVMTHVDGRFWRTLRRLAFAPGFLTNEYFRERRASYIPPFRLYLVLSLVFFGVASLTSAFEGAPVRFDRAAGGPATQADLAAAKREIASAREQIRAKQEAPQIADAALGALENRIDVAAGGSGSPAPKAGVDADAFDAKQCSGIHVGIAWLEPAVKRACERAAADGGKSIGHAFAANVPKMMFVFLPLIAAAMLLLYWHPRRYYVEHLVFYLHVHAGLFLLFSTLLLIGLAGDLVPAIGPVTAVFGVVAFFYSVWYVWRAMRAYYGDGRLLTFVKSCVIFVAYFICLTLTFAFTAIITALEG